MKLVFDKVRTAPVPFFVKPVVKGIAAKVTESFIAPNLERLLDFMEAELAAHGPWFAGAEFSAADIQMSFPAEAAQARAGLDNSRPKLMAWLERCRERPAYRKAIEVGGPLVLA
jgi:glutathione S-transferase